MQRGQLFESQAIFGPPVHFYCACPSTAETQQAYLSPLEEFVKHIASVGRFSVKQVVHKSIVIFNIKRKQGFQFTFFLWSLTLRHKWWIVKNISLFCRSFTWWQHGLCEVPIWRDARHWKSHRTQNLAWQWKVRMIGWLLYLTSLYYFFEDVLK